MPFNVCDACYKNNTIYIIMCVCMFVFVCVCACVCLCVSVCVCVCEFRKIHVKCELLLAV